MAQALANPYNSLGTDAEREEFNKIVLFIAATVTLVSPIAGIQTARNVISKMKGDMDLRSRDNTRNF